MEEKKRKLVCKKCNQEKNEEDFRKSKASCKECMSTYERLYNAAHPERSRKYYLKYREYHKAYNKKYRFVNAGKVKQQTKEYNDSTKNYRREWKLNKQYGLSIEDLNQMKNLQCDKCAICNTGEEKLCVDHDHLTNRVRGLLCRNCNTAIGLLKDDKVILLSAESYLRRNS